ncbi:unnamed protein product [Zymoseptoria tritici ST99CH_1E4]|uniref:Metallo-beta-lactamase domain-containing protein n=2 Tax=Zymoseptoria tritici TaxID=1047171 RepID=A0A2H1G4Q9_ZYMTR|nr:unnamed protein product [Zymoseptoria tritici ST99CH_1E4]
MILTNNPSENPQLHTIFSPSTQTWQFILADPSSKHAVIIDPVLDNSITSKAISTAAADALLAIILKNDYIIDRILETNSSADWPSAARYLRTQIWEKKGYKPRVAAKKSLNILKRMHFRKYCLTNRQWEKDFDGAFADGEKFLVGSLTVRVMRLSGRSKCHVGYRVGDLLITGDCVFHAEQAGVSKSDYESIQASMRRVLSLPKGIVYTTSMCRAGAKEAVVDDGDNNKAAMACQGVIAGVAVVLNSGIVS